MDSAEKDKLRHRVEKMEAEIDEFLTGIQTREAGNEAARSYANELSSLTNSEALEYLRSVDEAHVAKAFLILSAKLTPNFLIDVCLELLERDGAKFRLTGAVGLGSSQKGTRNAIASTALAKLVRNGHESNQNRQAAYASLLLVNGGTTPGGRNANFEPREPDSDLDGIDWKFVDSFLPPPIN